ncbi:MAG: hypothetical protein JWL98_1330 [Xanthomonadaceae bacterium]|nr:hypothetical protein [Xanthomonadaceae bacterium]
MVPSRTCLALLLPTLTLALLAGCSKTADSTHAADASPAATDAPSSASIAARVAAAADRESAKACDLVTPAEMSAILGSTVDGAESTHKSSGKTECIYKPANAPSPYVEFSVEWGEGETAMAAMGAMGRAAPGIADPYQGIGDQAVQAGTALMIRSGQDLVTITFSGVDDAPAKARKIFDTAKARM